MRRSLILLLALALTLTMVPAALAYDYHDYSQFPLANGDITLRLAVRRDPSYGADADKTWFWTWMKQASGLNFEIEQVLSTAVSDRKNLMFASGDLPDAMIGFGFTTSQLVKYGQTEGQLLALNSLITPDIMPYLSQWFGDYPDWEASSKAPDGSIYSLPCFNAYAPGSSERIFWNTTWLEAVGKEVPNTLDEFLDVLYAFKEAKPDAYPLGGGANGDDPRSYFLNALGYLTAASSDKGYSIALRKGELVIPGGDPLYKEFLSILHRLYADEIVNPSFFSMDKTAVDAMIAEDLNGVIPIYPYLATPEVEKFSQWTSGYPLTSEWNDTKQWLSASRLNVGGCVVSADAQHVETLMRWLDFFFGDLGGLYMWNGPAANSEDCIGMTKGYIIREDGSSVYVDVVEKTYESNLVRNYAQMMGFFNVFGNRAHAVGDPAITQGNLMQRFYGAEMTEATYDMANGDQNYRYSMLE
ncbi:MAG TPA: extracellular solute-binding protein, partial [Clostridia bacterium]|nr:extracellular solute-binding protein [Clostridia bacterium]